MTSRRRFLRSAATVGGLVAAGLPGLALAQPPKKKRKIAPAIPGAHVLPPLPYAYDALEPHIDAETMRLHHDKHHAGYVKGLNAAEVGLADARKSGDFSGLAKLERALAFHGSGHYNHLLFWNTMKPVAQVKVRPTGALARQINRDFGSLNNMKAQFQAAAAKVEGNGWGVMVYHPGFNRLYTLSILNHQNSMLTGAISLLICDVWEHAYYLKYQNKRGDFLKAWWNVVDWSTAEEIFDIVRGAVK